MSEFKTWTGSTPAPFLASGLCCCHIPIVIILQTNLSFVLYFLCSVSLLLSIKDTPPRTFASCHGPSRLWRRTQAIWCQSVQPTGPVRTGGTGHFSLHRLLSTRLPHKADSEPISFGSPLPPNNLFGVNETAAAGPVINPPLTHI